MATQKLWLLTRENPSSGGYDEYYGFVVRAPTKAQALTLLKRKHTLEDYWNEFKIRELKVEGPNQEILSDFYNG